MREEAVNGLELATNIFEDVELYYVAAAIKVLSGPGRRAYLDTLHRQSLGPKSSAEWLARRAGGGWEDACRECAMLSGSDELVVALGQHPDKWSEDVRIARAESFMCMMVEIIAQRAWQQAERSIVLPDLLYTFFHPSPDKAAAGFEKAKTVWQTIMQAVKVRESSVAGRSLVKSVLGDCYFAENPLVKDLMLWLQRPLHRSTATGN